SQPQRGRSATRRKRGSAAEASEPGQLGVARTVTLAGVGEVTYGELAITQLRRQVAELQAEWGNEADFVRQKVGRLIVSQSAPPTQERVRMWVTWAKARFRVRGAARVLKVGQLERLASEILATLEKAGAHLRLPGSPSSPRPGTTEQASRTDSDGGASGDPRRHRQKRQMPVEATSTAASSDPSVSSSPTAAETRGSLAGTLLGSTVELEGIGKVPYVQLAIE
ncbi:KRUF family protein, partial [Toxoplasma gondii GT1]